MSAPLIALQLLLACADAASAAVFTSLGMTTGNAGYRKAGANVLCGRNSLGSQKMAVALLFLHSGTPKQIKHRGRGGRKLRTRPTGHRACGPLPSPCHLYDCKLSSVGHGHIATEQASRWCGKRRPGHM
jgi:hypothetical protein